MPRILDHVTSPAATPSWSAPFDGDLSDDLALALQMADAADAVTMARFDAADLDVQLKADASHVTEADLATERAIRGILAAERPADGILGEEEKDAGNEVKRFGEEMLFQELKAHNTELAIKPAKKMV